MGFTSSLGEYWTNTDLESRSAFLFDLRSLPPGSVVTQATLALYVTGIEGVFRIDECNHSALYLCFGGHVEGQGRLPGRLGAVYLHDTAPGHASDPQSQIQR